MAIITELSDFLQVHGVLLASAGLPEALYEQLFCKLTAEEFDGADFFHIEVCEGGRQRRLVLSSQGLAKHSRVFLVDHAWSFRLPEARTQLQEFPGLVERLSAMMCVDDDLEIEGVDTSSEEDEGLGSFMRTSPEAIITKAKQKAKEEGVDVLWLELDELGIDDHKLLSLDLTSSLSNLVGLSLWGNKLESVDLVLQVVAGLKKLRALWLNATPVNHQRGRVLQEAILAALPQLEIYNSKFTENYTEWAVGRCSSISEAETTVEDTLGSDKLKDIKILDLSNRNIHSFHRKVFNPEQLPLLTCLNLCENPLDHDSRSDLIEILRSFVNLQSLEIDIPGPLGSSAVGIVESLPNLCEVNGINASKILEEEKEIFVGNLRPRLPEFSSKEPILDRVIQAMWAFLMTYRLANEEQLDETPIWYMMDDLGAALRHSDDPNFRVAPFMFMPDGTLKSAISYSLLWPIKDVQKGEECTRDFLFGIGEDKQRSARLTAWFHTPIHYFEQVYAKYQQRLSAISSKSLFLTNLVVNYSHTETNLPGDGRPFMVYTDIPQILETLTRPEFILGDNVCEADIIWISTQIDEELKKAAGLKDHQFLNQFPFEACIVMKHHLAQTIQQAYGAPAWFQTTYNMETDLAALIGDYNQREREGRNNLWIVKPWNMARTIDTTVSGNLPALIRLMETGPKICQKYIEQPALFQGKKFDLRYLVLVRSIQPLEAFLCDVFWARLANNKYTLDERTLSDYDTHFTVMNYGRKLTHINTHEFVPEFEKEHRVSWLEIHQRVQHMIRSVFEGAAMVHPEMHCSTARAIYGVDVMLDNTFQPKLLEVTYCPDCTRACKYDVKKVTGDGELMKGPDFFNNVFGCLFLNSSTNVQPL